MPEICQVIMTFNLQYLSIPGEKITYIEFDTILLDLFAHTGKRVLQKVNKQTETPF